MYDGYSIRVVCASKNPFCGCFRKGLQYTLRFSARWNGPLRFYHAYALQNPLKPFGRRIRSHLTMRILYFLSENLNKAGGGIVHFMSVARGLKKLGHDVTIMGPQYFTTIPRFRGLKTAFIPLPGRSMLTFFLYQFLAALLMPFVILIFRPQAILIRGGAGIEFLLMWIARMFKVRVILEVNGVLWDELASRGFPTAFVRFSQVLGTLDVRAAHRIISVTPAIGQELVRATGVSQNRVFPVQNGADPELFGDSDGREIRQRLGIPEKAFVVGYVGNFCTWHGVAEMIRSGAHLPADLRKDIRYLFVGDGELWEQARQIVEENNLGEIVFLPGPVEYVEVPNYLAAFDVGLTINNNPMIGRYGFSPLKFWEYLAAGLAVIVQDNCNLTLLVTEYDMGLIAMDSTPGTIASAVMEAYGRRDEMRQIGKRNRKLVFEKFSWLHVSEVVAAVCAGEENELAEPLAAESQCSGERC